MKPTVYDFKEFYGTDAGGVVRAAVFSAIQKLWPDMTGRHVMVFGYGAPYHDLFAPAERLLYLMPPDQGAYPWPEAEKNSVAVAARTALPIQSNTLDGVVLIHSLEYTNATDLHLDEIWRVLKSQGRLMIIVPSRTGFWARAEWSPFGQGTPFTLSQVHRYLRDALFIPERHVPILYTPPLRLRILMRCARFFETYCPFFLSPIAGLHVVEASKQVYAGLALPATKNVRVRGEILVPAGQNTRV